MLVTRRTLLAGSTLALTPGGVGRAIAQVQPGDTPDLDQLMAASARLLGVDPATLDRDAGARILAGLLSLGDGPGLSVLADDPEVTGGVVANAVVAAWTSGVAATSAGPELVLYTDAGLWDALDYTKPSGFCGGDTGYWAEPPQT